MSDWIYPHTFRCLGVGGYWKYGAFKEGIPRHDTIALVICRLKADEIESAFQSWASSLIETTGADIIAVLAQSTTIL